MFWVLKRTVSLREFFSSTQNQSFVWECSIHRPLVRVCNEKLIFLFLNQNICCRYSKEPSQWDGSFEHPKHMLKIMGKKIFTILRAKNLFLSTETNFQHKSRTIALYFFDKIYPSKIPNHSSPISTHIQSLKKIVQKMPKILRALKLFLTY